MKYIAILGKHPALSLAELESVYGSNNIRPICDEAAQVHLDQDYKSFDRLGGSLKIGELVAELNSTEWQKIINEIKKLLPSVIGDTNEGKITLGLSSYGTAQRPQQLNASALELKRFIKQSGRSVRVVPNNESALNTAKTYHNNLTSANGIELLILSYGGRTSIARVVWVQNIDAYRKRDQERPYRDARVGMLPPKLAQIIINLAATNITLEHGDVVLDPFCGTGVILQEASLMGYDVYGSDLNQKMVDYTDKNLLWLAKINNKLTVHSDDGRYYGLEQADACTHTWSYFGTIAAETYLGRALTSLPDPETLQQIMSDCNIIHKKFLQNVARQTTSGFRLCIAIPAWKTKNGFKHLGVLDKLSDLGYNRIQFAHVDPKELLYHRPDQTVARELVILERK